MQVILGVILIWLSIAMATSCKAMTGALIILILLLAIAAAYA